MPKSTITTHHLDAAIIELAFVTFGQIFNTEVCQSLDMLNTDDMRLFCDRILAEFIKSST